MDKNELYINELSILLDETDRFFRLFSEIKPETEATAKQNLKIIADIAQSEFDIISELLPAYSDNEKEYIQSILRGIKDFISETQKPNLSLTTLRNSHHTLVNIKERRQSEIRRNEILKNVFQFDNSEMNLHEAKLKALQEAVDLDMKVFGKISEITDKALKVQHCKLEGSKVTEDIPDVPELMSSTNHAEESTQFEVEHPYQGAAYLKGNGKKQKPILLYGNSEEDLLAKLKRWNLTRTGEMKFVTCYIKKHNSRNNKYENPIKYDVATGVNITPIYLKLPNLDKPAFLKLVSEIKANGAKYSYQKKAFYITRQDDLNKFAMYLPTSQMQILQENQTQKQFHMIDSDGEQYTLLQYAVLTLGKSKNFSTEQMETLKKELLAYPELSSDSMGKILFAIRDGIPPETVYQPHKEVLEEQCKDSIILKLNENRGKIQVSVPGEKRGPVKENER